MRIHERTEVDSEDSGKEEEHSRESQVKQKETMASTSKGISSRHACLVFSYVIYVNTYGPINVHLCRFVPREQNTPPQRVGYKNLFVVID